MLVFGYLLEIVMIGLMVAAFMTESAELFMGFLVLLPVAALIGLMLAVCKRK